MAATSHSDTFRLTLDHYGKRISIEHDRCDLNAVELAETFYSLAKAAEWQPKSIVDAFREVADKYNPQESTSIGAEKKTVNKYRNLLIIKNIDEFLKECSLMSYKKSPYECLRELEEQVMYASHFGTIIIWLYDLSTAGYIFDFVDTEIKDEDSSHPTISVIYEYTGGCS